MPAAGAALWRAQFTGPGCCSMIAQAGAVPTDVIEEFIAKKSAQAPPAG